MRRFEVGDIFENTCIFTGGSHTHKVTERKGSTIICEAIYEEIDGTHRVTDEYEIHEDERGEYIVLWTYKGDEGRCYASEL